MIREARARLLRLLAETGIHRIWRRAEAASARRNASIVDWMLEEDSRAAREEFARRVRAALESSPVAAGHIHDIQPHRMSGHVGVVMWVTLLNHGARVDGLRIWIDASGLQDLVNLLEHVRSPEFREAMGNYGDSYT